MKTIVVGDLHGKYEVVDKVLALRQPTVFVGDYLDSYDRSVDDQVRTLMKVLAACQDREDVTALMGNHEMSYLEPEMRCSGYRMETQAYVNLLRQQMYEHLDKWVRTEGFLISHAGVSRRFLDQTGDDWEDYLVTGRFQDIGYFRGGTSPVGGLFWCDWNREFEPVEGVKQIVGHTRGQGIREKDGNYCIDCLEDGPPAVLAIEDGTVEVWDLDEV